MTVYTKAYVRSISEQVYRIKLAESAGARDPVWRAAEADRMIAKDGDGGVKFSNRAGQYDPLTRIYLDILKVEEPK